MTGLDSTTRAVLALAFPALWPEGGMDGAVDAEAVLKALRKNKIPLLSLRREGLDLVPSFRDSTVFAQALAQAKEAFTHYRQEFADISTALDGAGIPHILMKSAGAFPYESDNFDILIPHGRRDGVDKALSPLGFVPQLHYREDWKFIYKRFQQGTLRSIAHLHEEVSWGVEPFLDATGLWERAEPSPDDAAFRVPAPRDSVLITMAHGVYENDCIKLGDLLKVHRALQRAGGELDWAGMEAVARGRGWLEGWRWILSSIVMLERRLWGTSCLDRAVAAGAVSLSVPDRIQRGLLASTRFPHGLGLPFSKGLFVRKILKANGFAALPGKLGGFLRDNLETFWPLPMHRPLIIAVSGMDGAGKSTVIHHLHATCKDLELKHEVQWFRAGNSDFMQGLNKSLRMVLGGLLKRATNDTQREHSTGPSPERVISNTVVATLWYQAAMFELLLRTLFALSWARLRRRVVICDRYLGDSLVDLAIRCGRTGTFDVLESSVLARSFPQPDLSLVLLADAASAHSRKEQEFTLEQMQVREVLYKKLAARQSMVSINTEIGKEATMELAQQALLSAYISRNQVH